MSLKPLFDRVVIKDAEMEETTKGGLIGEKIGRASCRERV